MVELEPELIVGQLLQVGRARHGGRGRVRKSSWRLASAPISRSVQDTQVPVLALYWIYPKYKL